MDKKLKIVCLLLDAPYYHPLLEQKLEMIKLLANKDIELVCFFYLDGIHQLNTDQFPKNFTNIGSFYEKIHQKYPKIQFLACSRCTGARGYINLNQSNWDQNNFLSSKLFNFVKIVSIRALGVLIAEGFQIIQL